jgi:hypothetical protein
MTEIAKVKDAALLPEKYLEVDKKQLDDAKNAAHMKPMNIRFIPDGVDRTLDEFTTYPKQAKVEGASAQMTVQELRELVAKQEDMDIADVNFYVRSTIIPNNLRIGQCFADWMGFGLESWPPQFISKPRIRGFEVQVHVPGMRDTSVWDGGKLHSYVDRTLIFDVLPTTTVRELKDMIKVRLRIPVARQLLTAMIHKDDRSVFGEHISLDDSEKTMSDYGVDTFCAKLVLEKNPFDENGMYVFDDAYWDETGYHPQPADCWIPNDSLSNRARPDASEVDPNMPATILTDRRAADNKRAKEEASKPKK